jgi:hypothetical protein
MRQQHQEFYPDEEAIRRHQSAIQEHYPFQPDIANIDDRVFHTLAEQVEVGEYTAEEGQLIYESWVRIFYYGR